MSPFNNNNIFFISVYSSNNGVMEPVRSNEKYKTSEKNIITTYK